MYVPEICFNSRSIRYQHLLEEKAVLNTDYFNFFHFVVEILFNADKTPVNLY